MRDVVFYTLYLAPFVILWLYRDKTSAYVFKVSCANVLMLSYMLYDHVGLVAFYNSPGGIKQLLSVNQGTVVLLALYSLVVVVAYVGTGVLMGKRFTRIRVPGVEALRKGRINWFPLLAVVALLTPVALWKVLDQSPLLLLLAGHPAAALDARVSEVTTNRHFLGIKSSYFAILWVVLVTVQIVALIIAMTRRKWRYWLFVLFVTVVYMFESFSGVSKGVIIGPLLLLVITYALIYSHGVLVNKTILWAGAYVLLVVAAFTSWAAGMGFVSVWYPFERLFLGNLLPQYVVVDHFNLGNLLYGATAPAWFSFGQHKQFLLDVFAWREIMRAPEGAAFYTAPSSFVAEAHANFHAFGVVAASMSVFFVLRVVDYLIGTIRSELMFATVMVYSSLHFMKLAASGAVSYLVDYYYWALLLFALVGYRISLTGRLRLPGPSPSEAAGAPVTLREPAS